MANGAEQMSLNHIPDLWCHSKCNKLGTEVNLVLEPGCPLLEPGTRLTSDVFVCFLALSATAGPEGYLPRLTTTHKLFQVPRSVLALWGPFQG